MIAPMAEQDHKSQKQRVKESVDRRKAAAQQEKGLLIVHTGSGKGKTTAAMGMVLRCLGHGLPVAIIQFVKGALATGETQVLERFPDLVRAHRMGEGFTWETQNRERDIEVARRAWETACRYLTDPGYTMVILDELNIVLRYEYLAFGEILPVLQARPAMQHVVVTGRSAKPELIEAADLVTEMNVIKHPFRKGIKAQAGVEF
jgi:cob(I)alamin adenosyltransferase